MQYNKALRPWRKQLLLLQVPSGKIALPTLYVTPARSRFENFLRRANAA